MRRGTVKLVVGAALAASAALGEAAYQGALRVAPAPRVVPALADPALVPGVARCTSDGACTVTDELGTRRATVLGVPR
jgi:hypothetical protein